MLGIGFLYALQPVARMFFPDAQGRIQFLKRHSNYFNAQPYCASLALGYVLRREKDIAEATEPAAIVEVNEVLKTKEDLCGMLGLMGDQIFWQLLKPEAAALGMTAALIIGMTGSGFGSAAALIGVILFLLAFNPLHFWMRWWGLKTGYQAGESLPATLASGAVPKLRRGLAEVGIFIALILTIVAFTFARNQLGSGAWIAFILGFGSMTAMLKARIPIHLTLVTVALLCLIPVLLGLR